MSEKKMSIKHYFRNFAVQKRNEIMKWVENIGSEGTVFFFLFPPL
jgi:hypothetical protein